MLDKQNFNGNIGESRTNAILSENFLVLRRSVDIDGADFIVEIPFNTIQEFRNFKEQGIVQAKFFENGNEVKIAKEYVEDIDTLRTNFFAILHTNNQTGDKLHYFFTASQIKKEFRLRTDKKTNKDYFIFNLTTKRTFDSYKNLSDIEISRKIKEGIIATEEYSRQKLIREVEEKHKKPIKPVFETTNVELFKSIKGRNIVDQLYICLNTFNSFRRITSWRLVDKISFSKKINTRTYYNGFTLHTTHEDIWHFFSSLEINKEVKIKDKKIIENVKDGKYKVQRIIELLNNNLIIQVKKGVSTEKIDIQIKKDEICDFSSCSYNSLNFAFVSEQLKNIKADSTNLWLSLQHSIALIKIGQFENAKILLEDISALAKENKEPVIYFISLYNLRDLAWKSFEENIPDIEIEIDKLNVSSEYKSILKVINNGKLSSDYSSSIDEIYSKIKEYKQRKSVNDTSSLAWKLYYKFGEYINFIEGNYLTTYKIHDTITEKVIESLIVSYSMTDNFSSHYDGFNDFILERIIHFCEPDNLLKYFQRNKVYDFPYRSDNKYFSRCLSNFFSSSNVNFLKSEIVYLDNRTKNVELRRNTEKIFQNLCILLAYLKFEIDKSILKKVIYFIQELDLSIHELSILAHPLLRKSSLFDTNDIIKLITTLIEKKLTKGFLITNLIYTLNQKNYNFKQSDENLLSSIFDIALKNPEYGILKAIQNILSLEHKSLLSQRIENELRTTFSSELFYHGIISNSVINSKEFIKKYIESFENIVNGKPAVLFRNISPYTGIAYKFRDPLNKLVTVIYKLDDKSILSYPTIQRIREFDSYYDFILDLDCFRLHKEFNINWLLENQSKFILIKLAKSSHLKERLKDELSKDYNEYLGKIYFDYFQTNK